MARKSGLGSGLSGLSGLSGIAGSIAPPSSLLTGLSFWYELSEAGTGDRNDSVTPPLNLTNTGGATQTTGVHGVGNATLFTGAENLNHTNNAAYQAGDIDFTVCAWVNPSGLNAGEFWEIAQKNGADNEWWLDISADGANQPRFLVWDSGDNLGFKENTNGCPQGSWSLLIAYHDSVNNLLGISINNANNQTGVWSAGIKVSAGTFKIGNGLKGAAQWVGGWKRLLTPTEKTTLYNAGFGISYPFDSAPTGAPSSNFLAGGDSKSVGYSGALETSLGLTWGHYNDFYNGATVALYASAGGHLNALVASLPTTLQYACLTLGTNDLPVLPDQATTIANYQAILDALRTQCPSIQVGVSKPWRRNQTANANTFAGWIDTIVASRAFAFAGPDERTYLEGGDDGATNTYDGVHPTATCYTTIIAPLWETAMGL